MIGCHNHNVPSTSSFWKKEFAWSNTGIAKRCNLKSVKNNKRNFKGVIKEYARYCTLHGVQYLFKDGSTLLERTIWLAIMLASFVCASLLVNTMWIRFTTSPTTTAVKDTHLPLHTLNFPAISICAVDKIKRDDAYQYLSKYVNITSKEDEDSINYFLTAMTLFRHPTYQKSDSYMEKVSSLKDSLSRINLTHFMLHVMPKCDEVFNRCYWIGQSIKCCELFHLQRTEEGFCYSFNSLTSYDSAHCSAASEGDAGLSGFPPNNLSNPCVLRRNTAAGSSSGLEIFLKGFNTSNRIINANRTLGASGNRVQVFDVSEFPESGMGNLLLSEIGMKLYISIKPSTTVSTEAIRKLDVKDRFCYFPDEQHLSISMSYTQKSCLIQCRLNHIYKVCNCRPYYFNLHDNRVPICNATQVKCIADHNSELRFFSPPSTEIRGFNDSTTQSQLNCSQCLPTCHEIVYDTDTAYSEDTLPLSQLSHGFLDIFYRNEGAVRYQRDVTFGWLDLLVSFGGIAGLFLGFSLLSVVEFIYWGLKLIAYQLSKCRINNNLLN